MDKPKPEPQEPPQPAAEATVEEAACTDNVQVVLRGPDGKVKQTETVHNLITTAGRNELVARWDDGTAQPTHMAIGTGATAAAAGDTTLQTELDRNALTSRVAATNVLTMVGDWAAGDGTGAITEAGVLSASTNGTLFSRAVFSVINKAAGDTLSIQWTYTMTVS
jgi:hypothetical protein